MSLSSALSTALSGLNASMSMISVASNNVSNSDTTGYTTKTANLETVDYGSNQGGVSYSGYTRATDSALTNNYTQSTTSSSYYSTLDTYMTQISNILDSSSSPPQLSDDISQFSSAWSEYSSDPESSTEELNVINAGNTLAKDINSVSDQINSLSQTASTDLTNNVSDLNSALQKVASLNSQIQSATNSGQSTGDLEDEMDQAELTISKYTNISVQGRSNGQVALYTSSGQPLVDGSNAYTFSYNTTSNTITDQNGNDVTDSLSGGSLQAGTQFLSTDSDDVDSTTAGVGTIAKLKSQLKTLVNAFTSTSNSSGFASTYATAASDSTATSGTQNGQNVASNFFTVDTDGNGEIDLGTFAVNSDLLDSSASLPQTDTADVANTFNTTNDYAASGLDVTSQTYSDLTSSILTNFQQMASNISDNSDSASTQTTYYQTQLSNETGVNLDEQLSDLTMYENSYAACAHIISTLKDMMNTLMDSVG